MYIFYNVLTSESWIIEIWDIAHFKTWEGINSFIPLSDTLKVVADPGCHLRMTPCMAASGWAALATGKYDFHSSQCGSFYLVVAMQLQTCNENMQLFSI